MAPSSRDRMIDIVSHAGQALSGAAHDYNSLLEAVGEASVVLIGEATHGTHEFYRERARITERLIKEKGFTAVAVEADWPDAYRVNRYVLGFGDSMSAVESLEGFRRFPTWMWRNTDVVDFIGWLREYNDTQPFERKAGFYGLDLYSLHASVDMVVRYLESIDPPAARKARERYACFDHFGSNLQEYGLATELGMDASCEEAVVSQLIDLQRHAMEYARRDGRIAEEEFFNAEQNARVARDAERYYRIMFRGRVESWNWRDRHMMDTLVSLMEHLRQRKESAKVVVWAHNSHIGDASHTEMARYGEFNIGQLAREQFRERAFNIGFTTYTGTVTAASDWDGPADRKRVREGLPGSYEQLLHETGEPCFLLTFRSNPSLAQALSVPMLERAIGVIYAPATERQSHYLEAVISRQFDALIHWDVTRAVVPLERGGWHDGEVPETFPSAV